MFPGQEPPLQRDGLVHYSERLSTKYLIRESTSWKMDNSCRKGKKPFAGEKVGRVGTIWFCTELVWLSFPITQGHILSRTGAHELPDSCCSSQVVLTIRVLMELVEMTDFSISHMVSSIWMRIDWHKWLINTYKAIWVPIIFLLFILSNNSISGSRNKVIHDLPMTENKIRITAWWKSWILNQIKQNLLPIGHQIPKSLCIMDLLQSIIYNPLLWVEGWRKTLTPK